MWGSAGGEGDGETRFDLFFRVGWVDRVCMSLFKVDLEIKGDFLYVEMLNCQFF